MNRVSGTAAASIKHQLEGRDSEFMKLTCAVVMGGRRAHRKDRN